MPVQPREVRCLQEEVVIETGIEDQVDVVPMVLEHRHEIADPQILDAAIVEEYTHPGLYPTLPLQLVKVVLP